MPSYIDSAVFRWFLQEEPDLDDEDDDQDEEIEDDLDFEGEDEDDEAGDEEEEPWQVTAEQGLLALQ